MIVGYLFLHIHLPGCTSLKQKRSLIKPLIVRLHREFNLSVAEIGLNDLWQETLLGCALAGNDSAYAQRALQTVIEFTASHWPDFELIDHRIETF
jgi:uncharacterized protein YlxP (DUF503 family)